MAKTGLIGARSRVFAQNSLSDVLSNPEVSNSVVSLFDIDKQRHATSDIMARRIGRTLGLPDLHITATTDRR